MKPGIAPLYDSGEFLIRPSLLTKTIVAKAPYRQDTTKSLLLKRDIENMGNLCFVQLVELRHRGAFSAVAQAFCAVCERCVVEEDAAIKPLLPLWYEVSIPATPPS